ncbi:MAG: DmsC/YnfH family molybdoenzyme membrane anchor subunit [Pseudomonadota bacterium]|nr:DmsC/YnfH family molybdoenzyme membrane anchor subunit [Pseudomonadota bacterium]
MYEVRTDEPNDAFLRDDKPQERNRHGDFIDLLKRSGGESAGQSLNINGDNEVGENPNRNKQHGFHFTADNCIACHACEAACAEKNDTPAHLAFRSVGYVEGGTYPAYTRLNISMACNHCDDPVCLKGCPTRAYTKFAEYGAVLQDPDICFGCGYCTWVCPYNAPQLDPEKGQVSKCNMCVDRLEVGLKPACVAACLGGALDFGVIESTPEGRDQAKLDIPGFPTPDITHPNIRFQQKRSLPREMTRTDSMPVKYHRDDAKGGYVSELHAKHGSERGWSWNKLLLSHESAHVLFTLSTQAVLGAFLLLVLAPLLGVGAVTELKASGAYLPLLVVMLLLLTFGLYKLNMHLGKPHRFYRGFNNLRHSPVSREIAGVSAFFASLAGYVFFSLFDGQVAGVLTGLFAVTGILGGLLGLYFMARIYRIKARPYWDHWQTASAFFGNTIGLGALLVGLVTLPLLDEPEPLLRLLSWVAFAGLALEAVGHVFHARDLKAGVGEGAAAYYEQTTSYGYPFLLRNLLLGLSLLLAGVIGTAGPAGPSALVLSLVLATSMLAAAVIGRSLFFVLVIPTTMPGAFFWRNRGFAEHARETGLAHMPQVGVAYEGHHPFRAGELIQTARETSFRDMVEHVKGILVWR